jgi:hypothetical protein
MAESNGNTAVDGALLIYHRPVAPWIRDASTVMEHVGAFGQHSRHRFWTVNTDLGFPSGLEELEFRAILIHYCVFGMGEYRLSPAWLDYLDRTSAYKIAFFQDECTRCQRRFRFLNEHSIDCVYTCLEPSEFAKVYGRYTNVGTLVSNVPGYVPDHLPEIGRRFTIPDAQRTVDVGYRGRPLPAYLGRGAMEKHEIGVRFAELARDSGLRLDVATGEADRLYGDNWYRFMAKCRCVLGVESGVSAFDLEDEVFEEYSERLRQGEPVGLEDLSTLARWEDVVYYRTVSPRHFEAAALRVCQVLFEGRYSGALEPMVHYVPLKKDFSNLDEVVERIRDPELRRELTDNAYRDLIASGHWSYARLLEQVDDTLALAGVRARPDEQLDALVTATLGRRLARRRGLRALYWGLFSLLAWGPINRVLRRIHPVTSRVRHALGIRGQDTVPG